MQEEFEIVNSKVRKVLDSRGNPTIEAEIYLRDSVGRCSSGSGASTGKTEVKAFPKGGVDESIKFFEDSVKDYIIGLNAFDQISFDKNLQELDGTEDFSAMGGNLATSLSVANAKAVANHLGIPLYALVGGYLNRKMPRPIGNVIGGGKHSRNGTTIQEFLVSTDSGSALTNIITNAKVHRKIGDLLSERMVGQSIGVGDERAWTTTLDDLDALDVIKEAVKEISSETGHKIEIGIDLAASNFYRDGKYIYRKEKKSRDEQIEFVKSLRNEHGVTFIEDPLDETDFEGFAEITASIGSKCVIVGDDIYTTNPERVLKGIEMNASNAVLIKVNQIGTLSRTYETVDIVRNAGWKTVVSHRSGETTDNYIAHLAVAFGSYMLKTGTIGGERLAKLNELTRIEESF